MLTCQTKTSIRAWIYLNLIQHNLAYRFIPRFFRKQYKFHYRAVRWAFSRTYPWYFIKQGDTVVQIGASSASLGKGGPHPFYGPSTAFIMASVVGPEGSVYVIEPSNTNAQAVEDYAAINGLKNIKVIRKGISNERKTCEFLVDDDQPCENVIVDGSAYTSGRINSNAGQTFIVEFDSFQNLLDEYNIPPPNFVSVTINGAEHDALKGMTELMKAGTVISFVIQKRQDYSRSLDLLNANGYHVHVGQMPPNPKSPRFLVATAYKPNMEHNHLQWCKDELLLD